ncbi:hypothetical protein V6N13_080347 [Hibiscus sabdariffa]
MGRMGSPQADARSTLVPKHAEMMRAGFHDQGDDVSTDVSKARAWAATTICAGPHSSRLANRLSSFDIRTGCINDPYLLPSRPFQALFNSLFKVIFIFPSWYLCAIGSEHDGALTPSDAPFQGTWARSTAEDDSPNYNSDTKGDRFSNWAIPDSLVVTKGIIVSFFSSAY